MTVSIAVALITDTLDDFTLTVEARSTRGTVIIFSAHLLTAINTGASGANQASGTITIDDTLVVFGHTNIVDAAGVGRTICTGVTPHASTLYTISVGTTFRIILATSVVLLTPSINTNLVSWTLGIARATAGRGTNT